jgi:hypothetical protein
MHGSSDMAVQSMASSARGGGAKPGLERAKTAAMALNRGARRRWRYDEGGRRQGRRCWWRPMGEEGVSGGSRLRRRRHREGAQVGVWRCDLTGGAAERGRAVRRCGTRTSAVGGRSDSEAACGFGQRRWRGRFRTGAVGAAFKARARGTVAVRWRVARRVAPGRDGSLTSGPGTERKRRQLGPA